VNRHLHFQIVIGKWKFENWHFYRLKICTNVSGKYRWRNWSRIF